MKNRLFAKLAAAEMAFRETQFLSPVVAREKVQIRIAGVVMSLSVIEPKNFEGWGIFRAESHREAVWVRDPSLSERRSYLNLFPAVRMILALKSRNRWIALPATEAESRFGFQGEQPVHLVENCEALDTVIARFDGQNCWFEKRDPRMAPKVAQQLRAKLVDLMDPNQVEVACSTSAHREAYQLAWQRKIDHLNVSRIETDEARIRRALARGGAQLDSYREVGNSFRVNYRVNGENHRTTVDRQTLAIQSAGICLSGFDANFDLQSLVGVVIEGQRKGEIYQE